MAVDERWNRLGLLVNLAGVIFGSCNWIDGRNIIPLCAYPL